MKTKHLCIVAGLVGGVLAGGCNKDRDQSLKADLTAKAGVEQDFLGVHFTVQNGIVTLAGECPTQKAKDAVVKKVKNTYQVDSVIDQLTIAPVTIGTDFLLKKSVDSVMQFYAAAAAVTKDSTVQLMGEVPQAKQQELVNAINGLKPKAVENHLVTK
jgi:osmotically-inducible protein OsmY